jgi:hypothetical protein
MTWQMQQHHEGIHHGRLATGGQAGLEAADQREPVARCPAPVAQAQKVLKGIQPGTIAVKSMCEMRKAKHGGTCPRHQARGHQQYRARVARDAVRVQRESA